MLSGERAGNRTPNLVIKSHLLYQLSYAPSEMGFVFGGGTRGFRPSDEMSLYQLVRRTTEPRHLLHLLYSSLIRP